MNPNSSGSFGAVTGGGGNAIAEAMQDRGMDASVLNQVTPTAPTAPERGLPQSVGATPPSATQRTGLPPQGMPGGLPPNSTESSIIVKSLDSRLKSLSKLQEMGIQV